MKQCINCGEEKDLDSFYEHPGMSDGHLSNCKECKRQYQRNRYKSLVSDSESAKELRERWRKKQRRRRQLSAVQVKERARRAVSYAVEKGRMPAASSKPCQMGPDGCGGRHEYHHDDYSKPLDVRCLCRNHHVFVHHYGEEN